MKKLFICLTLIFVMLATSCQATCTEKYTGNHPELYTVAINSVLWLNGHSWGVEFACNPEIEVIEKDSYGRTMFIYHEEYYGGSSISFSSLLICQSSTDTEVFYYEDVNYIVKDQLMDSKIINNFTNEDIEYLKEANDWNKELSFEKCIKKDIIRGKPNIPNVNEIEQHIIEEFNLISREYYLNMTYLTSDSNNSNFILYGYIDHYERESICFVGLVEKEASALNRINILTLSDPYDYKTEFINFKEVNGWY